MEQNISFYGQFLHLKIDHYTQHDPCNSRDHQAIEIIFQDLPKDLLKNFHHPYEKTSTLSYAVILKKLLF